MNRRGAERLELIAAFQDRSPLLGRELGIYKYPARFHPRFAGEAIEHFTRRNDLVIDPFVGGGTSVVEALARGRRIIASDLNPLACLITRARTTPLTRGEADLLRSWASSLRVDHRVALPDDRRALGLPPEVAGYLVPAVEGLDELSGPLRTSARAVLLRLGQWLLEAGDGKSDLSKSAWIHASEVFADHLLHSLEELVARAEDVGIARADLTSRRRILCVSAAMIAKSAPMWGRARLVLTSPPYPGVHVLYHRWQVRGRRETAAPFWIADAKDGAGPSFYTLGGRHELGLDRYFVQLEQIYRGIRPLLTPGAHVVQVVSFRDKTLHLPRFRQAMRRAGLARSESAGPPGREVPGRRWYARGRATDGAQEVLFVYQPR